MPRSEYSSISVSRSGSMPAGEDALYTVVWVRGEHDIATKASLVVAITRAGERDDADLLVDLSGITFMDASTIGAIIGAGNRLRSRSQSVEVRAPSSTARRVLDLCGLASLVHASAPVALAQRSTAAALGTWVGVPRISPGQARDQDPVAAPPVSRGAEARQLGAPVTVEADRGGP